MVNQSATPGVGGGAYAAKELLSIIPRRPANMVRSAAGPAGDRRGNIVIYS